MQNLYSKIQDQIITELFDDIDNDIICESLNCKILHDLAKQLKEIRGDERDSKQNKSYRYDVSSFENNAFKNIFGRAGKSLVIQWDKITDNDVETIDTSEISDKDFKKLEKRIREVIKGEIKAIILSYNKLNKKYDFAFLNWGHVVYLSDESSKVGGYHGHAGGYVEKRGAGRRWLDLTTPDKIKLIKRENNIVYFIDLTDKLKDYQELRTQRDEAKKGIVYMDEGSLKRMAEENFARYKKIVAQNKANRLNNTALINEVGELIQKISTLATDIAKDPVTNADKINAVNALTTYVYDERRYVPGRSPRQPGYYSGKNGLLPMLAKYTKALHTLQTSGGTDYDRQGFKAAQDELKKTIENIKQYAEQYNIEL